VKVFELFRLLPARWVWLGVPLTLVVLFAARPVAALENNPANTGRGDPRSMTFIQSSNPQPPSSAIIPGVPALVPAPPALSAQPLRWAYMVGSSVPQSLRDHADQIDVLAPAWFHSDADGMLYGNDSPAVTQFAKAHGIRVVPIVTNGDFQASVAHTLVSDGNRQTQLLDSLQWLSNNFGYDGINIDFENMRGADRTQLNALMSNVYARLHPLGKLVTMAIPAKTSETYSGFSGAFDYAGLAPNVDLMLIMAYDQHFSGGPSGPIADVAWVNDTVNFATSVVPPSKLLLGLPFFGYNWPVGGIGARAMGYNDVVSTVFANGAEIHLDQASQSPYFTYGGRVVWFENSTSLRAKVNLVLQHGLAGWGGWRLGQEDPNFWSLTLGGR
jgi:spore germination protein YaaH